MLKYEEELIRLKNDIESDIEFSDMSTENKLSHIEGYVSTLKKLHKLVKIGKAK
jgi:hypothetical protein